MLQITMDYAGILLRHKRALQVCKGLRYKEQSHTGLNVQRQSMKVQISRVCPLHHSCCLTTDVEMATQNMVSPNTQSNLLLNTEWRDTFCLEEVLAGNMTALDVTTHAQGSLCNTDGTVKDVQQSYGMFSLAFSMLC